MDRMRRIEWILLAGILALAVMWMLCGPLPAAQAGEYLSETVEQVSPGQVRVYARPVAYRTETGLRAVDPADTTGTDALYIRHLKGVRGVAISKADGGVTLSGPVGDPCNLSLIMTGVEYDGKSKAVSVLPAASVGDVVDLGGLSVQTRADGCRVLVPGPVVTPATATIRFRVASDGLDWSGDHGRIVWRSRTTGKTLFVFRVPGLCDKNGKRLDMAPGSHVFDGETYTKRFDGLDKLDLPKGWTLDVDVVYSDSGDGAIGSVGTDFATARAGSGDIYLFGSTLYIGFNDAFQEYRLYLPFDMTGLEGHITAATLSVYAIGNGGVVPTHDTCLLQSTFTPPISADQWGAIIYTECAPRVSLPWLTDDYTVFTLDATGRAYVESGLGGVVTFAIVHEADVDNDSGDMDAGGSGAYMSAYANEHVTYISRMDFTLETTTTTTTTTLAAAGRLVRTIF